MNDIDAIFARLQENEEVARKFHQIEAKILSVLNFTDLFEVLLTDIRERFKVPYAWITLIDKSEALDLIKALGNSDVLKDRMSVIDRHSFLELIGSKSKPLLINDHLKPFYRLLPKNRKYFIKSLAVAPLFLDGALIGSLNQADFSRIRFMPGIDTSLLEQLALKVSLCLSNVTAHEKLKFLAYRDPLTGLLNRRVMESALKREFVRAKRYKSPLSVVFMDLDYFKGINDRYGHDHGDELLKYVARNLLSLSRDSDVVARFAGDEFVVVLPETAADNAQKLMDRLQAYFSEYPLKLAEATVPVSISFGVSSTEDPGFKSAEQLLKAADEMLYRAKKARPANARETLVG